MSNPIKGILCFMISLVFLMLFISYKQSHPNEEFQQFLDGSWWIVLCFAITFLAGVTLINRKEK